MFFDEIHFFNSCNKGDIHGSRELVKIIIQLFPNKSYYYHHTHGPELLKDISIIYSNEKISFSDLLVIKDNKLFVNTWLGQMRDDNVQFCSTWGCNSIANKELLKYILKLLNKDNNIDDFDLVPSIDYSKYDIKNIDLFFDQNTNHKILICNGPVLSGQCPNFLFDEIILNLTKQHPNIDFILTQKTSLIAHNIFYTDDIIKKIGCDLNEVSYLSTKCSIVVGRASGPWAYAQTKASLSDVNKTFICFNNNKNDAFFLENTPCTKIWSNDYSLENIKNIFNNTINLKLKI